MFGSRKQDGEQKEVLRARASGTGASKRRCFSWNDGPGVADDAVSMRMGQPSHSTSGPVNMSLLGSMSDAGFFNQELRQLSFEAASGIFDAGADPGLRAREEYPSRLPSDVYLPTAQPETIPISNLCGPGLDAYETSGFQRVTRPSVFEKDDPKDFACDANALGTELSLLSHPDYSQVAARRPAYGYPPTLVLQMRQKASGARTLFWREPVPHNPQNGTDWYVDYRDHEVVPGIGNSFPASGFDTIDYWRHDLKAGTDVFLGLSVDSWLYWIAFDRVAREVVGGPLGQLPVPAGSVGDFAAFGTSIYFSSIEGDANYISRLDLTAPGDRTRIRLPRFGSKHQAAVDFDRTRRRLYVAQHFTILRYSEDLSLLNAFDFSQYPEPDRFACGRPPCHWYPHFGDTADPRETSGRLGREFAVEGGILVFSNGSDPAITAWLGEVDSFDNSYWAFRLRSDCVEFLGALNVLNRDRTGVTPASQAADILRFRHMSISPPLSSYSGLYCSFGQFEQSLADTGWQSNEMFIVSTRSEE